MTTIDGDKPFKRSRDESCPAQSCDEINIILKSMPRMFNSAELQAEVLVSRKRPVHGVYISPKNPTIVYATICYDKRVPWLATDRHHEILENVWQDASHWVVGRYVLMPDHLHLFAAPQATAVEFDSWVQYFKSQFTKRNKDSTCVWQTDHWDTRIRNLEHYEEKSIYMLNNPVRAGFVADANDWKYQGVVHELRWE